MAASGLTWYKTLAKKLIKAIRFEKQTDMAILLNIPQSTFSYRIRNVYPELLEDLIRLLDVAGYEIKEKEEVEYEE